MGEWVWEPFKFLLNRYINKPDKSHYLVVKIGRLINSSSLLALMAKALKFDLSDLVQRPEFLRELQRAAQLTIDHPGEESMFLTYADEHYHAAFVNEAVLGLKIPVFHSPELSELVAPEGAITQERVQDPKASLDVAYEPGKGGYLPQGAYVLVSTHFHPFGHDLRPSRPDLLGLLAARNVNYNLREMNGDLDELEDEKEIEISDVEEEYDVWGPDDCGPAAYLYANPVDVIGLARGDSGAIDLVVYQNITEHLIEPEEFYDFQAHRPSVQTDDGGTSRPPFLTGGPDDHKLGTYLAS